MSNTDRDVNNVTININLGGITWSFREAEKEQNLITAPNTKKIIDSAPVILGDVYGISGKGNICHNGVAIKNAKSWDVGVPEPLSFATDLTAYATQNYFEGFGAERFFNSELCLVTQRFDVEPHNASRPTFSDWHHHKAEGNSIILTYQFSDALATELKSPNGKVIVPHESTLLRMGAGIIHRSQTNNTESPIRRTWGAIIVYEGQTMPKRGTPYNTAFTRENRDNVPPYDPANFGNNFKPYATPKLIFA